MSARIMGRKGIMPVLPKKLVKTLELKGGEQLKIRVKKTKKIKCQRAKRA